MSNDAPPPFASKLPEGWQRFLAHTIEHGFLVGRRRPEDFIRHFPPSAIMEGLEGEPQKRANILVICTGMRMKIAVKKSVGSCAEDLQIALDEDETDAETVVTLFDPDDRVLYLDPKDLWAYVTEGEFWEDEGSASSREHLAYMLRRALDDALITHREIVEGITTEKLAERLPREELGRIIAQALSEAHDGAPFDEKKMLELVPASTLVESIPLAHVWTEVVVPQIAARHGLAEAPEPDAAEAETAEAEDDASPASEGAAEPLAAEPSPDDLEDTDHVEEEEEEGDDLDLAIDDVLDLDDDTTAGQVI